MERAIFEQPTLTAPTAEVVIPTATYRSMATRLVEAIGERNYFSGTLRMPLVDLPEELCTPAEPQPSNAPAPQTSTALAGATPSHPEQALSTPEKDSKEAPSTPAVSSEQAPENDPEVSPSITAKFTLSLIVYRTPSGAIRDLVPVWWELSTYCNGVELLNDFSFRYLRAIILD